MNNISSGNHGIMILLSATEKATKKYGNILILMFYVGMKIHFMYYDTVGTRLAVSAGNRYKKTTTGGSTYATLDRTI